MIKSRTKLGQNFLKDRRALDRIASVLEIKPEDVVIEIGPGHGELTRRLLEHVPKRLISIEKDGALIKYYLEDLLAEHNNLEIIEGDALKKLPELVSALGTYKLIGNIPFYITGFLLRALGKIDKKPEVVVLTVQKEVALRLCAEPPKMNLLSASVGIWGKAEVVRFISKKSFKPSPKVDSAIVKITPHGNTGNEKYYPFIKALFSSPRKTILNNLKNLGLPKEELEKGLESLGIASKSRPQNLKIEEIKKLSSIFTSKEAKGGYN